MLLFLGMSTSEQVSHTYILLKDQRSLGRKMYFNSSNECEYTVALLTVVAVCTQLQTFTTCSEKASVDEGDDIHIVLGLNCVH